MNFAAICYQDYRAGKETDEANAAAWHEAQFHEMVIRFLEKK